MKIPTREELVEFDGLDERHVLKCFLGKSQDEAYAMLAKAPGAYTEDLTYMAAKGLAYYLPVYEKFARSSEAADAWDFMAGVITALSSRIKHSTKLPPDALAQVKTLAAYLKENAAKFGFQDNLSDKFYAKNLKVIESA